MEEKSNHNKGENGSYTPPKGSCVEDTLVLRKNEKVEYKAVADWIILQKDEKPAAEMFYAAYFKKNDHENRPITFVFNGGPGAASAFLHMGAMGPKKVGFNPDGTVPKPPVKIIDNPDSWLIFTDLVFIDPIGTGFSRTIDKEKNNKENEKKEGNNKKEYYKLKRDLESLGEFIQKLLSQYHRWDSPCFIAGESYGGFRVAKLARLLQEGYGIGLNGAIIISPAMEFVTLDPSDYDILHWIDTFPSMALAAAIHNKSKLFNSQDDHAKIAKEAEIFATTELNQLLIKGLNTENSDKIVQKMALFLGLEENLIKVNAGRISIDVFIRHLLKSERKVCGRYDASITTIDPFPDREKYEGPDPTLFGIERLFMAGINTLLRKNIGLKIDRDYHLLSMEVNESWETDIKKHALDSQVGATDDLRYAMCINPHMQILISHGYYDLITPYHSSNRLVANMKLTEEQKKNLTVQHFSGGHMFYSWLESNQSFKKVIEEIYHKAIY
ncbi:MAG: peptidase S10 [Spirochaetes bacterium]|nr:peptidase S10 [Spirochaetota bacterium]